MAKKQTRRTFSVSRETYEAAKVAAAREGVATAQWVTNLIRMACPELPPQMHAGVRPMVLRVPDAPKPAPVHRMTAAEVRSVLGPQVACANCIDKPATHRGHIDRHGPIYNLCDDCGAAP